MDWAGLRFQDPAWLVVALAGPLVLLVTWLREQSGKAVAFPGASELARLRPGCVRPVYGTVTCLVVLADLFQPSVTVSVTV